MSYALSEALQVAVFERLIADPDTVAQSGGAIFDAMPAGVVPEIYIALGDEIVRDRSDITSAGAEHDLVVSVVTSTSGFRRGKALAAHISDVLHDCDLVLSRGICVWFAFLKAQAVRRGVGDQRRIDLTFRARVSQ